MATKQIKFWHPILQYLIYLGSVIGAIGLLLHRREIDGGVFILHISIAVYLITGIICIIRTPAILSAIDRNNEGLTISAQISESDKTNKLIQRAIIIAISFTAATVLFYITIAL